jgi:1,4-dihydroxy-2-naphthoate octaprenyltransferase
MDLFLVTSSFVLGVVATINFNSQITTLIGLLPEGVAKRREYSDLASSPFGLGKLSFEILTGRVRVDSSNFNQTKRVAVRWMIVAVAAFVLAVIVLGANALIG